MPQSDYEVSVNIQKATRTKDHAGGKSAAFANISGQTGLTATLHKYGYTSLFRHEMAPGGMESGPGVMTQNKVFFKFVSPFPDDVDTNYRIVLASAFNLGGAAEWASGTAFNVLFVRRYARTMQVDCELVV